MVVLPVVVPSIVTEQLPPAAMLDEQPLFVIVAPFAFVMLGFPAAILKALSVLSLWNVTVKRLMPETHDHALSTGLSDWLQLGALVLPATAVMALFMLTNEGVDGVDTTVASPRDWPVVPGKVNVQLEPLARLPEHPLFGLGVTVMLAMS